MVEDHGAFGDWRVEHFDYDGAGYVANFPDRLDAGSMSIGDRFPTTRVSSQMPTNCAHQIAATVAIGDQRFRRWHEGSSAAW
jgi:hypothetical protein